MTPSQHATTLLDIADRTPRGPLRCTAGLAQADDHWSSSSTATYALAYPHFGNRRLPPLCSTIYIERPPHDLAELGSLPLLDARTIVVTCLFGECVGTRGLRPSGSMCAEQAESVVSSFRCAHCRQYVHP